MAHVKRGFSSVLSIVAGAVLAVLSVFHIKAPLWAADRDMGGTDIDAYAALEQKVDVLIEAMAKEGRFTSDQIDLLLKLNACTDAFIESEGQMNQACVFANQPQQAIVVMPQQAAKIMPQQAAKIMPQQAAKIMPQQAAKIMPQDEEFEEVETLREIKR